MKTDGSYAIVFVEKQLVPNHMLFIAMALDEKANSFVCTSS